MGILISRETRVLVQGITGREGSYHTSLMLQYGTSIKAGCSPGKGGQEINGAPVYDTVQEAVEQQGVNASIIIVPPAFAAEAVYEAAESGIPLIVCITEGIPLRDTMLALCRVKVRYPETRIIGPNCPGLITPGECLLGIMPGSIFSQGKTGILSRSGTLMYQVSYQLTRSGIGQSTVVGIGGDPLVGTGFLDLLKLFQEDPGTEALCLIGEIGGSQEEEAAEYIKEYFHKPVVAYIAGQTAPPGKTMGHAGAIITAGQGSAESKIKGLKEAGAVTLETPYQAAEALKKLGRPQRELM